MTEVLLVLNEVNWFVEYSLGSLLRKYRRTAYASTVASRNKPATWWTPYAEEWARPPDTAPVRARKRSMHDRAIHFASGMVVNRIMRKVLALMFSSIPFMGVIFYAALNALAYARALHAPLMEAKHMSPEQAELWFEERQTSYWLFGFVAQILERMPFIGIVFSISNRIGAAMWAHDLEKRQQRFRAGDTNPLKLEQTRTELQESLAQGAGSYGDPRRADVSLPGDILDKPSSYDDRSTQRRPVPQPPRQTH